MAGSEYPQIYINQGVNVDKMNVIMKVRLTFYQLWSIFCCLPNTYSTGRCKYEWRFTDSTGKCVYILYDWNNNNRLIDTQEWYIGANECGKKCIDNFLRVLCDAIECYDTYYKCIEDNIFYSEIPDVNENLKRIRSELYQYRSVLKTM